jgi:hypothetical protein
MIQRAIYMYIIDKLGTSSAIVLLRGYGLREPFFL